jgi:hypothetical protein
MDAFLPAAPWLSTLFHPPSVGDSLDDLRRTLPLRDALGRLEVWASCHGDRELERALREGRECLEATQALFDLLDRSPPAHVSTWLLEQLAQRRDAVLRLVASLPTMAETLSSTSPVSSTAVEGAVADWTDKTQQRTLKIDRPDVGDAAYEALWTSLRQCVFGQEWLGRRDGSIALLGDSVRQVNEVSTQLGLVRDWGGDARGLRDRLLDERETLRSSARRRGVACAGWLEAITDVGEPL